MIWLHNFAKPFDSVVIQAFSLAEIIAIAPTETFPLPVNRFQTLAADCAIMIPSMRPIRKLGKSISTREFDERTDCRQPISLLSGLSPSLFFVVYSAI
jgi:hypothetical protein